MVFETLLIVGYIAALLLLLPVRWYRRLFAVVAALVKSEEAGPGPHRGQH